MGYESPNWGYPNCNLLTTLLTKSHEPLGTGVYRTTLILREPIFALSFALLTSTLIAALFVLIYGLHAYDDDDAKDAVLPCALRLMI